MTKECKHTGWLPGWWWRIYLEPVCWIVGHEFCVKYEGEVVRLLECQRCAMYESDYDE